MMNKLQTIVNPILSDITVANESKVVFRHRDAPKQLPPNRFIPTRPDEPEITGRLAQYLYEHYYVANSRGRGPYRSIEDRNLRHTQSRWFRDANQTQDAWSHGWHIFDTVGKTHVLKHESGRVRTIHVDQFVAEDDEKGRIPIPASDDSSQPGWFHVRGATNHQVKPQETTRIYFAVTRAGGAPLIHAITGNFNEHDIPFHFKIDSNPSGFRRADSGVLYAAREDWNWMREPLNNVYDAVSKYLRNTKPLFTKALAPGIGLAEEPIDGGSFGVSRCLLLARAMTATAGTDVMEERLEAVTKEFKNAGVPPEAPHLCQAWDDIYQTQWTSDLINRIEEIRQ